MDGKIFLYSNGTPPRIAFSPDAFTFDLQRFDFEKADTQPSGALFSVVKATDTYYGTQASEFTTLNLSGATEIKILGNITLESNVEVNLGTTITNVIEIAGDNVTLNLGEHELKIKREEDEKTVSGVNYGTPASAIVVNNGKSFTVSGTTGTINYSWEPDSSNNYSEAIRTARTSAAIQVGEKVGTYTIADVSADTPRAKLTIKSGNIISNSTAISMSDNADVSIEDGTVESSKSCGIYYGNTSPGGGEITISGGTLKSGANSQLPAIQISGSVGENDKYAKLTITGGKVEFTNAGYNGASSSSYFSNGKPVGNPDAIYAGGNTDLKISGGTITSTGTAVELRAGKLNFTGGTVTSTATQAYSVNTGSATSSGGQTFGAAIAVAQHTTKKNIEVGIGGEAKATGQIALAVENPSNKETQQRGEISATISGGTFVSTGKNEASIAAKAADDKVTININGDVTFAGQLETTFATTDTQPGSSTTGIKIAEGAKVTMAKVVLDEQGNIVKNEDGSIQTEDVGTFDSTSLQYNIAKSGQKDEYVIVNDGWNNYNTVYNKEDAADAADTANTWLYLTKKTDGDAAAELIVTLAPKKVAGANEGDPETDSKDTLALTTTLTGAYTGTIAVDLSDTVLSAIPDTFKTIDASKIITADIVKLNITGNDNITSILGSAGADSLTAVAEDGVTLDGGAGNDSLVGGSGTDTFIFSSGTDSISNYTYDTDVVSVTATSVTPPTDFTNATYDGSNLKITFDSSNVLTFNTATVAVAQSDSIYTYEAAGNKLKYIALTPATSGDGAISLGAGYTNSQFNGSASSNENYATINASNVTQKIRIRGNDKANYIVGGSLGGVLEGNDGKDTLTAAESSSASLTLNGGAGNDLLIGSDKGYNYFIYSEGSDSISGYHGTDIINVTGREVSFADVSVSTAGTNDLLIKFDNSNQLSISGGAEEKAPVISLTSGRNNYAVTKDYIALNGKSITLTAAYAAETDAAGNKLFNGAAEDYTTYATINAGLVKGDISIVGNANNNYIIGSENNINSLNGGAGDDTLVGGTVSTGADLFYYTAGKDVIENFGASKDKLAIEDTRVEKIANGKLTNSKLTFTVDKNNSLTFKFGDNAPFESVSLQSNAYLTKDGVVSVTGAETNSPRSLTLFASAKGKIDLNDELYSIAGASAISTVDAEKVKSQSVTLVGGTKGGLFKYYDGNKQRDGFEYGGGTVSISGYEDGRDRIDLGEDSLSSFTVNDNGVVLTLGASKTISIKGAAGEEVLLRDPTKGNGYKKMVFAATGVVQNKAKNPTMATVSAGVTSYSFADSNHNAQTVKKIYVTDVTAGASIRAGDKYNTVIDASKATNKVSLSGGAKNDKLIGSTGDADDLFVYTGGKDVIQNFGGSDQISLTGGFNNKLKSAKITAAKKSIKFKFDNKNVLTIKSNETMSGKLTINDDKNIYFKNAIGESGESKGSVSLTSAFSGTFKTQDSNRTALPTAATVDGRNVEKNLTFKGSSDAETLIGGGKSNRKTMFRGGGGADSLVGGDSKDTFFYAKGNTGDATIAKFDFANDKIKVSSGIISKIEKTTSGAIKFSMTNGKSTDAAVGSFTITSKSDGTTNGTAITSNDKIAIKANNTYYWFVEKGDTYYSASTGDTLASGTLITTENRLKNAPSNDYAVIDLNYSTNLAKNDIVAVKATTTNPNTTTT